MDKTMIETTRRQIISKQVAGVATETITPAGELVVDLVEQHAGK